MATSRILLDPGDAVLPTSNPAVLTKVTSSTTAVTNGPKVTANKLGFNQATDQHAIWNLVLPADFLSGLIVTLLWGAQVTSNNVIWLAGLCPVALSTDTTPVDYDAAVFTAADSFGAIAVPGTVGYVKSSSVTPTQTGLAAGRMLSVFVGRDADAGGDTAASDADLWGVILSYTS